MEKRTTGDHSFKDVILFSLWYTYNYMLNDFQLKGKFSLFINYIINYLIIAKIINKRIACTGNNSSSWIARNFQLYNTYRKDSQYQKNTTWIICIRFGFFHLSWNIEWTLHKDKIMFIWTNVTASGLLDSDSIVIVYIKIDYM